MRILITDGNERAALAAARSLIRAGHDVHVASSRRFAIAAVSRKVHAHRLRSDPFAGPGAHAAELSALAHALGIDVLLPMTDQTVEAVLEHRASFPATTAIPCPDLATYRAASDKQYLEELAATCGFSVPETRVLPTWRGRDVALPGAEFFPAVVKPHRSVVSDGTTRRKLAVTPVADAAACRAALECLPPSAYPVLLQRHIAGVGEGFFALRWQGRIVAMFAHRRLREKPLTGGVSVYRESIALDEQLALPGRRLLDALDWTGVAMIECKRDPATGRQYVMEMNGRFWGSLQLAIDAGVDFPALLVRCIAGNVPAECPPYRVGVRSRWFWGDVDHLYLRLKSGGLRLAPFLDMLRMRPGRDHGEIWKWNDPMPFLSETVQWAGGALARKMR
jgi:predicted ATP-grasp superfamily ATP-dependent carboligase